MTTPKRFWDRADVRKRLENSFTSAETRAIQIAGGRMCKPAGMSPSEWDTLKASSRRIANKALRELARITGREKIVETAYNAETAYELAPLLPYIVPRAQEEVDDEISEVKPVHVEINMPGFPPAPRNIEEWDAQMAAYLERKKAETLV